MKSVFISNSLAKKQASVNYRFIVFDIFNSVVDSEVWWTFIGFKIFFDQWTFHLNDKHTISNTNTAKNIICRRPEHYVWPSSFELPPNHVFQIPVCQAPDWPIYFVSLAYNFLTEYDAPVGGKYDH